MALSFPYCTEADVRAKLLGLDVSDIPDSLISKITSHYIPWSQRDVDSGCGANFDATETEEFYNGTGTQMLHLRHYPIREVLNVTLYLIPSAQWYQFKRWFYVSTTNGLGIKVARGGGVDPKNAALTSADIPVSIDYVYDVALGFKNQDALEANQTANFSNSTTQYGKSDLFVNTSLGTLTIPPRILFLEGQAVPFWNYSFLGGTQNVRVRYVYGYSDPTKADDLTGLDRGSLPLEITDATASLAAIYVLKDKGIFQSSGATSINMDGVSKNYGEMPYAGLIKYLDLQAHEILKRHKKLGV
jgi:hypothetical protein